MKRKLIIPISILLTITAFMLVVTIFKLYTEAEKVQRSIFASEVLAAGEEIVGKIDAVLKGDTLPLTIELQENKNDSTPAVYHKYSKKFLLDSTSSKPVGIVKSTISYTSKTIFITEYDTTFFDTNYRKNFKFIPPVWDEEMDYLKFEDKNERARKSKNKLDINLIEMDSNTINLLNKEFLNRIIKESLGVATIEADFDFALYNAFTTNFVVPPSITTPENILQSEYVFALKKNDKFISPHYLILYFPAERGIYFQRMGTIAVLIISLLTIILIISGLTLYYLYRQKKIADVRNDFINNMTHEFKTPIATISLACEAISDESVLEDTETKVAYISIIRDENNRLKNMVNNILQIAQLKKGQLKMDIERFDIHELIKNIAESVSLQITSNNGHLALNLNATQNFIFADKTHIENCIINLVENAIKYSKNNSEIEIKTESDKKNLIISVKDNGIGISKKNQKRIFHEFYRVSKGNVHDTNGYGMGLDYVKKIVSLHDGTITVQSEINKGSIFTLYLPIKKIEYGNTN